MKKQTKRLTRRKALEAIAQELEEIESEFAWQGFPITDDEPMEEVIPEVDGNVDKAEVDRNGDEGEGDVGINEEDDGPAVTATDLNAEDIEVAIDVFVSHLVKAGIVRPTPTFSEVFQKYFGADHRITQLAEAFEEAVQGYFGAIHYDDMVEAHEELLEIRKILTEELKSRRGD